MNIDFQPAYPEIFLLSAACLVLLVDLFIKQEQRFITYLLVQLTLLITAYLVISADLSAGEITTFNGMYVLDQMAVILKVSILLVTAGVFLYSRPYLQDRGLYKGEYYLLGLFATLGMLIMVSANTLLLIYLGLELLSLSMYAMVAFRRNNAKTSEAAIKYFILGAIASGMLLYGMSLLYGLSGSLELSKILEYSNEQGSGNIAFLLGVAFLVVGVGFKLSAAPFHMWAPDVYEGAPTSVVLFLGTAPKIAAFAMIIRLLVDGLSGVQTDWQEMLSLLAALSIAIGNVIAIAQTNIKRMLAYSTISHMGFLLMGVLAGTTGGYSAAMFYAITYAIISMGGFAILIALSRKNFEAENLEDLKGLNDRSPWYAFLMMLLLFSMAGMPPTVGFYAKLMVLEAVIDVNILWLAIFAVVFSVIGAFYYLRVVKLMYFDKPKDNNAINLPLDFRFLLSVNGLGVLALGLFPGALMAVCVAAFV